MTKPCFFFPLKLETYSYKYMLWIVCGLLINHDCFQRYFNSLWIKMKALIFKLYAYAHSHTHSQIIQSLSYWFCSPWGIIGGGYNSLKSLPFTKRVRWLYPLTWRIERPFTFPSPLTMHYFKLSDISHLITFLASYILPSYVLTLHSVPFVFVSKFISKLIFTTSSKFNSSVFTYI